MNITHRSAESYGYKGYVKVPLSFLEKTASESKNNVLEYISVGFTLKNIEYA